jgi:hypothetical protein
MNVLVFTTSVDSLQQVKKLEPALNNVAGKGNWNFALDDCDRILRITAQHVKTQTAIRLLQDCGYECAELDH